MRYKEKQGKRVNRTRWHCLKQYSVQCPLCRCAHIGKSLLLLGVSVDPLLCVNDGSLRRNSFYAQKYDGLIMTYMFTQRKHNIL